MAWFSYHLLYRDHNKTSGTQLILHTVYHCSVLKVPFRCRKVLHLTSCILFTTHCYAEMSIITFKVPRKAEMSLYPKEVDMKIKCGYKVWIHIMIFRHFFSQVSHSVCCFNGKYDVTTEKKNYTVN